VRVGRDLPVVAEEEAAVPSDFNMFGSSNLRRMQWLQ
jgi:hypothetical protein